MIPLSIFNRIVKKVNDPHLDYDKLLDKDLDKKVEQISQPIQMTVDLPPRRFTFKSSGISGLLKAHLGENLAEEIEKLDADD